MIRILLANNLELVISGLIKRFESESDLALVGVASNFEDTLLLTQKHLPDIVLFDYMCKEGNCNVQEGSCTLQEGNYIERLPELLYACPASKIVILTACQNQERHLLSLRYGAVGIVNLNQPIDMLIKAIHKVYFGEVWLTNPLANEMLRGFNTSGPTAKVTPMPVANPLTHRELTIARLLAQGLSVKQIASRLYISEKTVRNQLVIIYNKLRIHSHVELVLQAAQLGLKDEDE